MSSAPREISLTFIDYQVVDAVATITLQRPRTGNALNWALLEQLRTAVHRAINASDVEAIVIAAAGNAFVTGADLSFFVRCLERRNIPTIVAYIRASQEVFAEIANCRKPTVAAVDGAAIGGGVELALACRSIVGTPRASFSFPESSLSILPFSGGTYRLPDRVGIGLAKWMVYTGQILLAAKALRIRLIDRLVMPADLSDAARETAKDLGARSVVKSRQEEPLEAEISELESFFAQKSIIELCAIAAADATTVTSREVRAALKLLKSHSLPVLQAAESLFDAGTISAGTPGGPESSLTIASKLFQRGEAHEALARAARQQQNAYNRTAAP